ncbi:class II aldolase/adducin family protein [Candidatus Sumerlaeota bacterium]|nr:class II aldolase/adducin family protein [Candidatus Sumerlaeota bacterium]
MTEWQAKELMCEIGRRVWQRGYVASNDGNFSYRLDDSRVLTTPTMISKGFMTPADLCIVDMDGNQIAGQRKATSEVLMHLHILRRRPDVQAIVHAHPPHATAFAVVQEPIPKCVLPEVELFLGEIPILPYATPGTQALADVFDPFLEDFNVFLMANHGALAVSSNLLDAYHRLEVVDQYCRILILARQISGPRQLPDDAMAELFKIKERLGIPDRRLREGGVTSCSVPSPSPQNENASPAVSEEEIESIVRAVLEILRSQESGG